MYELYYNLLILVAISAYLGIRPSNKYAQVIEVPDNTWNIFLSIFAVVCMAFLPITLEGGADRSRYARDIIDASSDYAQIRYMGRETLFAAYQFYCAKIMNYQSWFILTATIYVGNYYLAAKRLSKDYTYVLFLMMLCYFQFYGYGTNTIRAGLASSMIILGLTYVGRPIIMAILFFIGFCIHSSMLVPIAASGIAYFYKNPKIYLYAWLAVIVMSYLGVLNFESLFVGFTDDNRASKYLDVDAAHTRYKVGFRWDFLAYSALPVIIGYYYIFTRNFKSQLYIFLYNVYLIANSFWVLVIRANFTDRFAFLSWFIMPVLLVYPLITKQFYQDVNIQRRELLFIMAIQAAFFYFIFVTYGGNVFWLWHR